MKYLLILLFLFSTQAFSGDADGKGLDCKMVKTRGLIMDYNHIWWLNNDKVTLIQGEGPKMSPKSPDLSNVRAPSYTSDVNKITWVMMYFQFTLDRKTLEIIQSDHDSENPEIIEFNIYAKGVCKVLEDFDEVKKVNNKDYIKKLEGNKI